MTTSHETRDNVNDLGIRADMPREQVEEIIGHYLQETLGYTLAEINVAKPWGSYFRTESSEADRFVAEFFPGLSPQDARLGREEAELSPKFLVVCPGQNLSWQLHNRRAERWMFLTPGAYYQSTTDDMGEQHQAERGEVVQFGTSERHRLSANPDNYTIVAEIWQHTDPAHPSDEADIVRLHDDYQRG